MNQLHMTVTHINNRYSLEEKIGQGGMGAVYRGIDSLTQTPVAVKLLRREILDHAPNILARFNREGETLRQLDHPNIVKIIEVIDDPEQPAIVMEYVSGGTLATLLQTHGPLPIEQVLRVGLELADALTRTHHLNIIHRDIKPANILVAADGTPRLTDFGTAIANDNQQITATGVIVGTFAYLSPEGCRGEALDARTDIWSFGMVLYEMLTGRRPFDTTLPLAGLLTAILTQPLPPLTQFRPDVPPNLDILIQQMLIKNRDDRIGSVRQIGAELEAILRGQPITPHSRPTPSAPRVAPLPDSTSSPDQPYARHNLPPQPTPFVGREDEVTEILVQLNDPSCRLLTLVGVGGIGKTRLALEVAGEKVMARTFTDGVYFIPLAALENAANIMPTVAETLGIKLDSSQSPTAQVIQYLHSKQMLLLFDNFEHVLEGADALSELLARAPLIKIMATSREALNLQEEWVRMVQGMKSPALPEDIGELKEYGAVRLFISRAQRIRVDFQFEEEKAPVVRICQLVEGTPLGIELAVSWLRMMTCAEIAAEIEKNLDFLTTKQRNLPERHRSMRAVFDYSWDLLEPRQQGIFAALAVFRGSFTRQAAQAVTEATLPVLSALVDKSLLAVDAHNRYHIHELLRQFALEKLEESPHAETIIRDHAMYYADFLASQRTAILGDKQAEALDAISTEFENIRLAWEYMTAHHESRGIRRSSYILYWYCRIRREYEGLGLFVPTAAAYAETTSNAEDAVVYATMLAYEAWFKVRYYERHKALEGADLFRRSLAILRRHESIAQTELIFVLIFLAHAAMHIPTPPDDIAGLLQESIQRAQTLQRPDLLATAYFFFGTYQQNMQYNATAALESFERARQIATSIGNLEAISDTSSSLAWLYLARGDSTKARELFQSALHCYRQIDDQMGISASSRALSSVEEFMGNYEAAITHAQRSIKYGASVSPFLAASRTVDMAILYIQSGQLENARHALQRAQSLGGDRPELTARIVDATGLIALEEDEFDLAVYCFHQALDIANRHDLSILKIFILNNYGYALTMTGDVAAATPYIHESLTLLATANINPIAAYYALGRTLPYLVGANRDEVAHYLAAWLLACPAAGAAIKQMAQTALTQLASRPTQATIEDSPRFDNFFHRPMIEYVLAQPLFTQPVHSEG